MIFSSSKQRIQWFLDFGLLSVVLTVKDLVPNQIKISKENLSVWSLLLFQSKVFLDKPLAQMPIDPNYLGKISMKEELLCIAGA